MPDNPEADMVLETGDEGTVSPLRLVQPVLICRLANFRILPRTSLMKQCHTRQSPIQCTRFLSPDWFRRSSQGCYQRQTQLPFTTHPLHHICKDTHCVEGGCGRALPTIDCPQCCPTTTAVGASADSVVLYLFDQSLGAQPQELDVTRARGMSPRVWCMPL